MTKLFEFKKWLGVGGRGQNFFNTSLTDIFSNKLPGRCCSPSLILQKQLLNCFDRDSFRIRMLNIKKLHLQDWGYVYYNMCIQQFRVMNSNSVFNSRMIMKDLSWKISSKAISLKAIWITDNDIFQIFFKNPNRAGLLDATWGRGGAESAHTF